MSSADHELIIELAARHRLPPFIRSDASTKMTATKARRLVQKAGASLRQSERGRMVAIGTKAD